MQTWTFWLDRILGLNVNPEQLTFAQLTARGLVVFGAALVMMRLSDRRSLTRKSSFEMVLLVVLASVLSRAVNGSAPLFPTIGGAAILVALHRFLAWASCRWPKVAWLIKGRPFVLVRDGKVQTATMTSNLVSTADVEEDLRLSAHQEEIAAIRMARLEASGEISFILQEKGS